jgi:hypothetical protein
VFENLCQSYSLKIADKTVENVGIFISLGMILTNKPQVYEEIMSRLNLWSAWCRSFENFWSVSLLCENVKMEVCRTILLLLPSSW